MIDLCGSLNSINTRWIVILDQPATGHLFEKPSFECDVVDAVTLGQQIDGISANLLDILNGRILCDTNRNLQRSGPLVDRPNMQMGNLFYPAD